MMFTSAARNAVAEASNAAFPDEGSGAGAETDSDAGGVDVDKGVPGAGTSAGAGEAVDSLRVGTGTVRPERVVVALFLESRVVETTGPDTTASVEEAAEVGASGVCGTVVWPEKATIKAPRMSAATIL